MIGRNSLFLALLGLALGAAPAATQEPAPGGPLLYTVAPGDTVDRIARDHSIPAETLASNSFLKPGATLVPGQKLLLLREAIDFSPLGEEFVPPALIEDAVEDDLDGDPEPEIAILGSSWERDHHQQLIFVERRQQRWKAAVVYQVRQKEEPCRMTLSRLIAGRPQVVVSGREGTIEQGAKELYTIIIAWDGTEGIELFRELEYQSFEGWGTDEARRLESEFAMADRDGDGATEIERVVSFRVRALEGGKPGAIRYEDRSKESFRWDPRQKSFYAVEQEVAKLDTPNRAILLRAIERLGGAGARAPATAIERFLDHESLDIQRAAARALGNIGSRASVDRLVKKLRSIPPSDLCCDLLESLGQIGDRRAEEAIRFFMEHKFPHVRGYARVAASQLGIAIPIGELVACLDEEPDHLKALVVQELTRRTEVNFGTDWTTWKDFGDTVARWRAWWKENADRY